MKTESFTVAALISSLIGLGLTAPEARANGQLEFGERITLGPAVNHLGWDAGPEISSDGLTLIFSSMRPGGLGDMDLWLSTRASLDSPWRQAENLGAPVNSSAYEDAPSLSSDGLTLYFSDGLWFDPSFAKRPGGLGGGDLWMSTRASLAAPWSEPVNVGPIVNSSAYEGEPSISTDGLTLYFDSDRPGGSGGADLWMTTRTNLDAPWSEPVNLGPVVNSSATETAAEISPDGLTLFFSGNRSGTRTQFDIWYVWRADLSSEWSQPVNAGPRVNTSGSLNATPALSPDGLVLYFLSREPDVPRDEVNILKVAVIPPPPALRIDSAVLLSWPGNAAGYVLQGAPTVEGPWTRIDVPILLHDGHRQATVTTSEQMEYYRLRQP